MIVPKSVSAIAKHLYAVSLEALKSGDKSRALVNFRHYAALASGSLDEDERNTAARIARLFGKALAEAPTTVAERVATLPAGFIPPTPETAVKLRKQVDPVNYMDLTTAQIEAAREIRSIYESLGRGLGAKGLNLNMDRVDTSVVVHEPWEGMSDYLQERLYTHFKPWMVRQAKARVVPNHPATVRDVVLLVLFDLTPLKWIDQTLGATNGTSAKAFKRALNQY